MKLYVVRHGKTDWNAEARFQGNIDKELNFEGREAAGKLGVQLENTPFRIIYSSPLIRAYETACLIRGHRNIKIQREEALREVSFGELEGMTYADWMNTDDARKYFFTKPELYVPPKGGETFEHAVERTKQFVKTVLEPIYQEEKQTGKEENILLVAHGALIGALTTFLENRTLENYWGKGLKGNCEAAIYSFDGNNWSLCKNECVILPKNAEAGVKVEETLVSGGVCIIPTDTVYGFSGIVSLSKDGGFNTDAHIRSIKGRSETKPLIQLIAKPEDIYKYTDDVIPAAVLEKWPGALTVIVNTKKDSPLYERFPTIAFRCPGDKWLRDIIENVKAPVFSTSVNRSGKPVLECIEDIKAEFSSEVSLIIDDGDKKGALPSTLITIENGSVKVLRQGTVTI